MGDFGKLNFYTSLNPASAFPLDARCFFDSLEAAQAAAATACEVGSTDSQYFFGQRILVDDRVSVQWYTIQRDGTLLADGGGAVSDEAVTLLVDGVNYDLDNLSEPVENGSGEVEIDMKSEAE